MSASLAPYCKKGQTPKAEEFVPIEQAKQHDTQILDMIERATPRSPQQDGT